MISEHFAHSIDEYAVELTSHSHQTLYWLHRHGYLDDDQLCELVSRMVVVPVRNAPKLGERLLARFFGRENTEKAFVFPITLVDDLDNPPPKSKGKPNLEIVKNDE
jgi:hypothetical protein